MVAMRERLFPADDLDPIEDQIELNLAFLRTVGCKPVLPLRHALRRYYAEVQVGTERLDNLRLAQMWPADGPDQQEPS